MQSEYSHTNQTVKVRQQKRLCFVPSKVTISFGVSMLPLLFHKKWALTWMLEFKITKQPIRKGERHESDSVHSNTIRRTLKCTHMTCRRLTSISLSLAHNKISALHKIANRRCHRAYCFFPVQNGGTSNRTYCYCFFLVLAAVAIFCLLSLRPPWCIMIFFFLAFFIRSKKTGKKLVDAFYYAYVYGWIDKSFGKEKKGDSMQHFSVSPEFPSLGSQAHKILTDSWRMHYCYCCSL